MCSNLSRYNIKHMLAHSFQINSCVIYGFSVRKSKKIKGFVFRHDFFRWLTEIRKYKTPGVRRATEKSYYEQYSSLLRSVQQSTLGFHKLCLAATAKTAKPTCRPWMESRRKEFRFLRQIIIIWNPINILKNTNIFSNINIFNQN